MSTAMFYPCNYGYINHTLSLDGDPVDVLVPTPYPLQPGSVIRCRPVGVLKMTDEAGEDAKLVAVPHTKLSKEYDHIKDVNDLPELLKAQIAHFFEHYKDLEKKANGLKLKAGISTSMHCRKASGSTGERIHCPGAQGIKFGQRGIINTINYPVPPFRSRNRA